MARRRRGRLDPGPPACPIGRVAEPERMGPPMTEDEVMRGPEPANLPEMTPPEWAGWEQLCKEATDTEDMIRYAALAIGRLPDNPPRWAVEACHKYHEDHERAGPGIWPALDGERLDKMADLIVSGTFGTDKRRKKGEYSLHLAAKMVLAEERGETDLRKLENDGDVRRLERLWTKELACSTLTDPETGQAVHPRHVRAAVRLAKGQGRHQPWGESLTPTPPTTSKKRP